MYIFTVHTYVCKALIEIYMSIVHHLSMSCSFFFCSKNFCHLFDIDDVDCLDEVYSMLLCREIVCLLGKKSMSKTLIPTIVLSLFLSLALLLLLLLQRRLSYDSMDGVTGTIIICNVLAKTDR
jgi:hypothetical protein